MVEFVRLRAQNSIAFFYFVLTCAQASNEGSKDFIHALVASSYA